MKRVRILIVLIAVMVLGGTANAQQDSLSTFGWHPQFRYAWIEGLFLPVWIWPVLGGGVDVDLLRTCNHSMNTTQCAIGLRLWYGTGTDAKRFSYKYEIPVY